jgi:hypothetical protein
MPEKLDRCVADVKGQKDGVDNPYAVCNASIKEDHLQEKQKFPYAFPAINSKDATEEAVAIGGGLSAQSVGGKTIKPDKEFDKLHEALMQEGGEGSGRKKTNYESQLEDIKSRKKPHEPKPDAAKSIMGKEEWEKGDFPWSKTYGMHKKTKETQNPEDVHPFGEGLNPFPNKSMGVSEGRDPTKTLDPEPSDVGHRDPSQTLDPSTEKYDYGEYDEGGPGSGPQGGFSNPNASSVGTPAKNISPHSPPSKSQGQPTVVKKRGSIEPLPSIAKFYGKALGLTVDEGGPGSGRKSEGGGQNGDTQFTWNRFSPEEKMKGLEIAGMTPELANVPWEELDEGTQNVLLNNAMPFMSEKPKDETIEACPQMDKLHEALTHESKS